MLLLKKVQIILFLSHIKSHFLLSIATNLSDYVGDNSEDADDYVFMIAGGFRPKNDFLTRSAVSIRTRQPTKFFGDNHFCNGAVVTWNIVLSAAHCVVDQYGVVTRPHRVSVVAGCSGRLKKTIACMEYRVLKIVPHGQFHRHRGNDIALLILETSFPASNKKIAISSLASQPPVIGTICQAVGWGQIYWDGPFTDEAMFANLTVTSNNECIRNYDYNFADDLLCVKGATVTVGLCRGDSGAPLFCDNKLHGILSEGKSCNSFQPTTYSDVSVHYNWIHRASSALKIRPSFIAIVIVYVPYNVL
uniref:Peptidase S1 domain-containing protein n=1 Tax=Glossina austeni TaxID=7395 RepID=A0A1A9UUH9_GLOAU